MSDFQINLGSNNSKRLPNKIFLTLFFLIFLAMGCAFTGLLIRAAYQEAITWTWNSTPCEIVQSSVKEDRLTDRSSDPFTFLVSYRYTAGSREYVSERFKKNVETFSDYSDAQHLVEKYAEGSRTNCYVNPKDASDAILMRGNGLIFLFVPLPLLFVLIGGGGIYFTWAGKKEKTLGIKPPINPTRSRKGTKVFGGVFVVIGCVAFYFIFVRTVMKIERARNWPEVPCRVISSQVQSHSGDHGSTYSVEIFYSYEFEGRVHRSNLYKFMGGSSSGYQGKQAVVNLYPPGSRTNCFVNPLDPDEAVLLRGYTPDVWFGLFPLLFVGAGAAVIISSNRQQRKLANPLG